MRWFTGGLAALVLFTIVPANQAHAADRMLAHVAGDPGQGLATEIAQTPTAVAVVGDRLIVADGLFGTIREVDLASGAQTVLHQPAVVEPMLDGPPRAHPFFQALAVAPDGSILVAQWQRHQVVRLLPGGGTAVVAGTGQMGHAGDGGPAAAAKLARPRGVAVDADGSVLVADTGNHVIRRISPAGVISTIAGTAGQPGFSGDGGPATSATLSEPTSVAVDSRGVVSFIDSGNQRLRQIGATGRISTLAAAPASSDPEHRDWECMDRPAARLQVGMHGLAVDKQDRLYLTDDNGCLYRIDAAGQAEWLAGGLGNGDESSLDGVSAYKAQLSDVAGIALGEDGAVYVAEAHTSRVRRIRPDGVIDTVAGRMEWATVTHGAGAGSVYGVRRHGSSGNQAPARWAQFAHIGGMAVDGGGGLVMADSLDSLVRRLEPDGIAVLTLAGTDRVSTGTTGPAYGAPIPEATDVAAALDGSLYVSYNRHVGRVRPDGMFEPIAGWTEEACQKHSEGAPALGSEFRETTSVDVGPDGLLYIGELRAGRIRRVGSDGRITTILGDPDQPCASSPDHPEAPIGDVMGVAVADDGTVYATNQECLWRVEGRLEATCVAELTPAPDDWASFGFRPPAARPDLAADGDGVVVSDPHGHRVLRWTPAGTETIAGVGVAGRAMDGPAAASPLAYPTAVAVAPDGGVFVYEAGTHRVLKLGTGPLLPPVLRLSGPDRIATAVELSRGDLKAGSALGVVLARADQFADALAGTPLAARQAGSLLLTQTSRLDGRVEAELRRVLPAGRTVYLLGGPAALAPAIEDRVRALGYKAVRVSGPDRYATAVAVAETLGNPATLFVTTGTDFPDALSAGAAAAKAGGAVLLTAGEAMPEVTAAYVRRMPAAKLIAVGGPASRAAPAAESVAGRTRFDTAARVAARFFPDAPAAGISSGASFPDALGAGAHAARSGAPLLLTPPDRLAEETQAWLRDNSGSVDEAFVAGGRGVLSTAVREAVATSLG